MVNVRNVQSRRQSRRQRNYWQCKVTQRESLEQSIVKTDQIIRQKKEDFIKKKMAIDQAIIDTPDLLKELIKTVNSLKKDDENSEKLDDLDAKLKELESKIVQ